MKTGFLGRRLRTAMLSLALAAAGPLVQAPRAHADNTLRIAMSLSDVPNLWAAPDGGFEGVRFGGYTVFDSLILWDLSSADKPSHLVPGLAESWSVDSASPKRWIFKLREAAFHDGSPWNADAAIWNLESLTNKASPQFSAARAGAAATRIASIAAYGKIDDHTIFIETKQTNSFFLHELSTLFFPSPKRFADVGNDWTKFARNPSGTGPYAFVSLKPSQEVRLTANTHYWDKNRIPKTRNLVLQPIPDANTRIAALRSSQTDMIDTLPPDAIPALKAAGFRITANTYPHNWMWRVNFRPDSPFSDMRVRKAANLAIDRDAVVTLLDGTATSARGFEPPDSPSFGKPHFDLKYDPEAAKTLLKEAGYGPGHPVQLKVAISFAGGGQMVSLSMNEMIQENLRAVGINVSYDVLDFTTMINMLRQGAKDSKADAINIAMTMQDPSTGIVTYLSQLAPPAGSNWGFYNNPEFDKVMEAARSEFDPVRQEAALARVNEVLTDDAAAILVVHDSNPRALSPKLKGFVHAKNWYQDFTTIEKGE